MYQYNTYKNIVHQHSSKKWVQSEKYTSKVQNMGMGGKVYQYSLEKWVRLEKCTIIVCKTCKRAVRCTSTV